MKKEATIGVATLIALAMVVGVSVQTGSKQSEGSRTERAVEPKRSRPSIEGNEAQNELPSCDYVRDALEDFLAVENLTLPKTCYESRNAPQGQPPLDLAKKTSGLKFIIALMPDPVHTHLSPLFDQFVVAIQEGAQDEKYDYDSSWLPWDDEESSYTHLADEKASKRERKLKENQPGIILFRRMPRCSEEMRMKKESCEEQASMLYNEGLIVFVVGEEATQGIHTEQFKNALEWIGGLQPQNTTTGTHLAILGPTFSGSFPSVAHVLSDADIAQNLGLGQDLPLAIFSGSVSSSSSAHFFQDSFAGQVLFHSFVQNDDEILDRFCEYMTSEQPGFEIGRVAIISEDETAYGGALLNDSTDSPSKGDRRACRKQALKLFYPRDISALRAAYQAKSLFDVGSSSQSGETQRRNLPTDLADPSGRVHDSIRTYGGAQTPLAQEASMMEIVAALRELHARYILLRGSNTLDQLFLANFLRRSYADARIVILSSDLMFIRERGSTGLGGAMTLSTYPLFPLERDWTEHQSLPAADRTFSADTAEGTYVAFRLLLNDRTLNGGSWPPERCHVFDEVPSKIFLPRVSCTSDPIPDYSPPFWTLEDQCGEAKDKNTDGNPAHASNKADQCLYPGPATWLSVIGVNRFWPMASLTEKAPRSSVTAPLIVRAEERKDDPGGQPEIPVGMKVFFLSLVGFAMFHAGCCRSGSYTAKPIFRTHFASTGDRDHRYLVLFGSCCVALLATVAGWGSGMFSWPADGLSYPWFAFTFVVLTWLMAWVAVFTHNRNSSKLAQDIKQDPRRITDEDFSSWNYWGSGIFVAVTLCVSVCLIVPLRLSMFVENSVLTYWRAMHLTSSVSPIVPILAVLVGLYLSFWFTLHGLALFGPDRPCLPTRHQLALKDETGKKKYFLRMFSQDAARRIEKTAVPLNQKTVVVSTSLFLLFGVIAVGIAGGVPVRSLGAETYSIIFLLGLDICCSLSIVETCRLYQLWDELRRLLAFLDRLPLRRTLASLRGFSWGSVWKMSGNVLEVRYKVISRQMECMNHTIAALQELPKQTPGVKRSLDALVEMRKAGFKFADWYSHNYMNPYVGDLTQFEIFQSSVAAASGILFAQLLVPAWRKEKESLLVEIQNKEKEKDESVSNPAPQARDTHVRNAEEFVCLNYLGFIQNILGRLRTMAMTVITLFVAAACSMSTYPFDPRQALSAVLIALFIISSGVIVKVYADMHRDATLSHVTNTKPGELGAEFWLKIAGFGFAPLIGVLTRIFPGFTDFIFSWLQPGVASLK
jgi:hypothetical protein